MTEDIVFSDGSDLSVFQELETQEILLEAGGKTYKFLMSSLVPADLVEARKRIARKQVDKDEQELFLAYMSLKKNHPKLKWNSFRTVIEKWQLKFIAVLYTMNGMDEVFRAINPGKTGLGQDTGDGDSEPIDSDDPDELEEL